MVLSGQGSVHMQSHERLTPFVVVSTASPKPVELTRLLCMINQPGEKIVFIHNGMTMGIEKRGKCS